MTDKLRDASVVAHEVCEEMEEYGPSFATKVIEGDRQTVLEQTVAKIVAYARGHGGNAWSRDVLYFADKIEAGEWK